MISDVTINGVCIPGQVGFVIMCVPTNNNRGIHSNFVILYGEKIATEKCSNAHYHMMNEEKIIVSLQSILIIATEEEEINDSTK